MKCSAEYEGKYREAPEDTLSHCYDKVRFLVEVTEQIGPGDLSFSENAASGLHWILRDTANEMKDCLEEMQSKSFDVMPEEKKRRK